ncbi:MAG TPA: 4-(cytidine 5'-diphospho)-2-C-methyl-D-erythritol kinase [Bryobacteraceae bacterium]|nr:4-(cytidine 5'-diphospho)-2-C-methyl-D-erythritol kinase [Bryobacteraceae bacterium]
MIRTARLKAFAKLNLGLRVLYRRPDNYHELRTVFQTISLADELTVRFVKSRQTRIEVEGTPEISDNLAARAARLVLETLQIQGDVRISLSKSIPMGAGLGGGSTDAAAILLSLPTLVGGKLPVNQQLALAEQLGSDVPFFLQGGTALGLGRGEELYPLPDRSGKFVLLICPDVHSSTADAYGDLSARLTSATLQNKLNSFQQEVRQAAGGGLSQGVAYENDFEEVVFARHPQLRRIKERLLRSGARSACMTGSGSAVFGVFEHGDRLARAKAAFKENGYAVSFLSRPQYQSAWKRALKSHTKGDSWPPQSRYAR